MSLIKLNGGENIVKINGIKQLTDAVYDKAKEMNHPIRKHETYWAMKAFMEIMVDVIKEDGYLRIYDIFTLERKWKNAKTYGIVPSFLMNWANDYLSRRIAELEHETIRQQWDKASLEKTLSKIHDRQQDKEKH